MNKHFLETCAIVSVYSEMCLKYFYTYFYITYTIVKIFNSMYYACTTCRVLLAVLVLLKVFRFIKFNINKKHAIN